MKKLTKPQIKEILKLHKLWLDTNGEKGEQADFSGQNLEGWNFVDANLRGAIFKNANLKNSYFYNANLNYVDFTDANLTGADIYGANLINANLEGAWLIGALLRDANIFTFQIAAFAVFHQSTAYPNGYLLMIGGENYFDLDDRIARNEEIAIELRYTDLEKKQYLAMLNFIKEKILFNR